MEYIPVEVIGNILSRVGDAKDVVVASITCRKWRNAFRYHLHSLTFNLNDSPVYRDILTSQIEILITTTIFQTDGLQGLSIITDDIDEFSASAVTAWLVHTRECLKSLYYNVQTNPSINILEICARRKLEKLIVVHNMILGVEPNYQRFPCLTFLSLSYVSISPLDLSLLLTACPKIETLSLTNLEITVSDAQVSVELNSSTLKTIYVEAISLDKFILEADSLEDLRLKDCAMEQFDLIGKGNLKFFKLDDVSVINFDLCEPIESLEEVDVSNFTFSWLSFYHMISRSSNLRVLRLWDVAFEDLDEVVYLEAVAKSFPYLRRLSFILDLKEHFLHFIAEGSYKMHNLAVLEIGWTAIHGQFYPFLENFLQKCPNLKKLIIHGTVSDAKTNEEYRTLANFTSSVVRLMREYMHVDVHFEYE
ncbi:hypothetical protein RND81_05G251400 [Saponaria officinalis]|uniref:F-box domain-containing protein n=1 Tax=Saponaria officinalis TaxID=3572 RepID=A0AAW1L3S7_SAPOF